LYNYELRWQPHSGGGVGHDSINNHGKRIDHIRIRHGSLIQAYHQGSAMQRSTLSEMATNKDTVITFDEYAVDYTEQLRWSFNAL